MRCWPAPFPFRDLIVLVAFAVVLGTLVIQGLTLKPLLLALRLRDGDPVGHEVQAASQRALAAGLASLAGHDTPAAGAVRHELTSGLADAGSAPAAADAGAAHVQLRDRALRAAREALLEMRRGDEIGDDAFHRVEEDLDWLEMAGRARD